LIRRIKPVLFKLILGNFIHLAYIGRFNLLTEEQKEWALIKTSIYNMKPKKKVLFITIFINFCFHRKKSQMKWNFQEQIIKFRKWKPIKYLFNLCIAFNIIILTLYYHRQPKEMTQLLGSNL